MNTDLVRPLVLAALAAAALAAATFVMKTLAEHPGPGMTVALVVLLAAGAGLQVAALRQAPLGVVYVAVIALQSLAVLAVAGLSGGGLDVQKLAGAGLMLVGASVIAG